MKKLFAVAAMIFSIAQAGQALAHGDKARYGGIRQSSSNDISVELVSKDGKATLYVEDHGKPVPTAGASGKLTVLNGGEKAEVALTPAGENMLVSQGPVKLGPGAKAIAVVNLADKRNASVRFSLK